MIESPEFLKWAKQAYPKLAFYKFERSEGNGVLITSGSSSQILVIAGKILKAGGEVYDIIDTNKSLVETCISLWGQPDIEFPQPIKKQPDLNGALGKNKILEILETIGDTHETLRTLTWTIYKVEGKTVKVGNYGVQVECKYVPYSSSDKLKKLMEGLL